MTIQVLTSNPLLKFCIKSFPQQTKRLVFIASLAAIARDTSIPEESLIKKLDALFLLSLNNSNALKLPISLCNLIWSNKSVFKKDIDILKEQKSTPQEMQQSAMRIAYSIPAWFSYSDKNTLMQDIKKLFSKENHMFDNSSMMA
jgi:hypothetical protein